MTIDFFVILFKRKNKNLIYHQLYHDGVVLYFVVQNYLINFQFIFWIYFYIKGMSLYLKQDYVYQQKVKVCKNNIIYNSRIIFNILLGILLKLEGDSIQQYLQHPAFVQNSPILIKALKYNLDDDIKKLISHLKIPT